MEEGKGKGRRMQGRESTYAYECNREARLASKRAAIPGVARRQMLPAAREKGRAPSEEAWRKRHAASAARRRGKELRPPVPRSWCPGSARSRAPRWTSLTTTHFSRSPRWTSLTTTTTTHLH